MNYKVKPFVAKVSREGTSSNVASQVESFIAQETADGWEFDYSGQCVQRFRSILYNPKRD
jgi:hypothetical protein